jgi:hypothetical protein
MVTRVSQISIQRINSYPVSNQVKSEHIGEETKTGNAEIANVKFLNIVIKTFKTFTNTVESEKETLVTPWYVIYVSLAPYPNK